MIPTRTISRDHVLAVLSRIDRDGVPKINQSRGVEIRHGGKNYPPKYVISLAFEAATGRALPLSEFITTEAEHRLRELGFPVIRPSQHPPGAEARPSETGAPAHELLHSAQDARIQCTPEAAGAERQLRLSLDALELDPEVRKRSLEALNLAKDNPESSIATARSALVTLVQKLGTRGTLDQAIRDLEANRKISQVTAIQMHTIQKIRNQVEYESAKVTRDDAQTCVAVLVTILKAVSGSKSPGNT